MRLDQPISAADYASDRSAELIPPGWYVARITEATVKMTKAGTGKYVAVRYDITGPTHQGRVVFGNLNISNPNPTAEKIGREQLSDLMRSLGLPTLQDTDQLIGGICQIKIGVEAGEGQYKDRNEIKGWKVADGPKPASMPAWAQDEPKPSAGPKTPPWKKG